MKKLEWVFDPVSPNAGLTGGDAASYVFKPTLDTFVREVVQNANDQRSSEDSPVEVHFQLHEVTGDLCRRWLEMLGWEQLRPHIRAVAAGDTLIRGQLEQALSSGEQLAATFLCVTDLHTKGLHGPEIGTDGNFAPLVRNRLVTTHDKVLGGGSFGLGKTVLWTFSGISTVAFASVPISTQLCPDPDDLRFIARSELPWHKLGEGPDASQFSGPGWLGIGEDVTGGRRGASAWGTDARSWVAGLPLDHPHGTTGTSIVVPFFFDPSSETQSGSLTVASAIAASLRKWFWPSLHDSILRCRVSVHENGTVLFDESVVSAEDDPDIRPFVRAMLDTPVALDRTTDANGTLGAGEVVERNLQLQAPGRQKMSDPPAGEVSVRLARASNSDNAHPLLNTVALMRGARMVVKYRKVTNVQVEGDGFFGVLRAGTARGEQDSDRVIEQFLRASEPPAHDEWTPSTNRLRTEYRPGAQARLKELWAKLDKLVEQTFRTKAKEGEEGPERLRKMFPLSPDSTTPAAAPQFGIDVLEHEYDDQAWTIMARVTRRPGPDSANRSWTAEVTMQLDTESGAPQTLEVTDFGQAQPATCDLKINAGKLLISVPKEESRVEVKVEALVPQNVRGIARRTRLKVRLNGKESV